MKKLLLLFAFIGLCACEKDVYTGVTQDQIYEQVFEKQFGQIAPTQTWGFNNKIVTRSADPRGNMWESEGYLVPADITSDERETVLNVFNNVYTGECKSLIDWDCFFVQQVYKGDSEYIAGNGGKVIGSNHMDWLCTETDKQVQVVCWWPYEETVVTVPLYPDHIFDFNGSNSSDYGGRMLMVNSNTNRFGYHESESNGVYWYFRMEKINGNYYVGLDYSAEGQNPNQQVQRDYIYNDWIIKVTPGKGTPVDPVVEEGRIICEDMGNIGDFDFNDVVFDAVIHESGKTEIILLAAGGTLDISVDGVNVGEVMGKMVNTGLTKVNTYYFESENLYNNLIDIPIIVTKTDAAGLVTSYELTAEMGKAPQKICVPVTFKWCIEYKNIKDAYPGFKDWVTGGKFWSGEVNNELIYNE